MKKNRFVLSLVLVGALVASPILAVGNFQPVETYTPGQFTDVAPEVWYEPYVATVYKLGLMKGAGGSLFAPNSSLDLAAAITLTARLHVSYAQGDMGIFEQATGVNWYDVYVNYAVEKGFWNGVDYWGPTGVGDYSAPITRGQLATLLANALPKEVFAPINQVADGIVGDVQMNQPNAAAIYLLYRAGILTGMNEHGDFQPDRAISRGELATVLVRTTDPAERQQVEFVQQDPTGVAAEQQEILDLVNAARKENNLAPMTLATDVSAAAMVRAKELVERFEHTRPDGTSCMTALDQQQVLYSGAGENVAWGQPTAKEVVEGWLASPGHRSNILYPTFTRLGVGIYRTADGTPYWVQLFCN